MNEVIKNEIEEPKKWQKDEKISRYIPRKIDKEDPKEVIPPKPRATEVDPII